MRPSELDTRRAALCCLGMNLARPEDVQRLFELYRDLNFRRVVIPPEWRQNDPERLLFATAVDVSGRTVVYVAFKGDPAGLEDIFHGSHKRDLSSLMRDKNQGQQAYAGYFHERFYDRLLTSVPSVDRILQYAEHLTMDSSSSGSSWSTFGVRIVFCGHGSGGVISHMALLTYLLSLSSMSSTDSTGNHMDSSVISDILEDTDNLISISFGAPLFCDESAVTSLHRQIGSSVGSHFFNFFAKLDPVPFLLFNCPSREAEEGMTYKEARENVSTALSEVGLLLDSPKAADPDHGDGYVRDSLARLLSSNSTLDHRLASLSDKLRDVDDPNPYGLFGSYLDIIEPVIVSTSSGSVDSSQREFERLAKQRSSSTSGLVAHLEAHAMISYFKASESNHYQEGSLAHSSVSAATVAVGEQPQVREASMVILGMAESSSLRARIAVTGRNLSLLLDRKCRITSLHEDRWSVVDGDDKSIVWESTIALSNGELRELERCVTRIKVETAFGRTRSFTEVHLRKTMEGSFAVEGLKHALGKLAILADTEGPHGLRDSVMEIRELVGTMARMVGIPEGWEMNSTDSVETKKAILDPIFRRVCEELCANPLVLDFDDSEAHRSCFMRVIDVLIRHSPQALLAIIEPILGSPAYAKEVAWVFTLGLKGLKLLVAYLLRRKSVELRTYEQIIKLIYSQIFGFVQGNNFGGQEGPVLNSEEDRPISPSIRVCEEAIYLYAQKVGCDNITFSTSATLTLKYEVYEKIKARIRLLHAVLETFYEAKRAKLIAVAGIENAGKSTLINLLRRHYTTSSTSEEDGESNVATGFCIHTSEVKGFYIGKNFTAVDFPGVGGVDTGRSNSWKAFDNVPDLCIIMVKFSGDVDNTCQTIRRIFAEKFCKRYILLVNQVDCIMKGRRGSRVWKEYSPEAVEKLRERYRPGPSGVEDTVHLCCLKDEDLYESEREELKVRGIIFGSDVARKIFQLLDIDVEVEHVD